MSELAPIQLTKVSDEAGAGKTREGWALPKSLDPLDRKLAAIAEYAIEIEEDQARCHCTDTSSNVGIEDAAPARVTLSAAALFARCNASTRPSPRDRLAAT